MADEAERVFDLLVIGGGINGCAIARDTAGRGLSVCLAEAGDLGGATSAASSKLLHGGLRYLEHGQIRLVREALAERTRLLAALPHIARPMRFVLPLDPAHGFLPGGGRRPGWMIRLGLFLYDRIGGRGCLPGTRALRLDGVEGAPLKSGLRRAYEYSDGWVDDSRLVVLTARDAATRGATVLTRTRVTAARPTDGLWRVTLLDEVTGASRHVAARALVNAAGPWAGTVAGALEGAAPLPPLRLVRGGHIVTRRLHDHGKAYLLQGTDGRIVFVLPFEEEFTLIGTTEADHSGPDLPPACTEAEQDYLCAAVSAWFRRPVTRADVIWTFSGIRALDDTRAGPARAASRDYTLALDPGAGPPLLTVRGGKITTCRRLAEAALDRLAPHFPAAGGAWTAGVPLPGGNFPMDGADTLAARLRADYPFLDTAQARRLVRAYGTEGAAMLGGATTHADLGRDFGAGLSECEVRWLVENEFARTAEDILWRRSKLGLQMDTAQVAALEGWLAEAALSP